MGIEFLKSENVEEFMEIAEQCHKDSAWNCYPFNREVCARKIKSMTETPDDFVCIYRKNEEIIGFFLASIGEFLFSDISFGVENGVYVKKEHRGGRAALLMKNEFDKWCSRLHLAEPLVEVYFGENADNEKTYSFFEKSGMIECGRIFRGGNNGLPKKS